MDNEQFQELVLRQLRELTEGQRALADGQNRLDARMGKVEDRLEGLETRMGKVEDRLEGLGARVGKVEDRLEGLDARVGKVEDRLEGLDTRMGKVEDRIGQVETGMGDIGTRIDNLEKLQLRVETRLDGEILEKIRALFDARQVSLDYYASIKNSLARIEEGLDYLRRRTAEHDLKFLEYDRELRLLRMEKK